MSGSGVVNTLTALQSTFATALPDWNVIARRPKDPRRNFLAVAWADMGQPAVSTSRTVNSAGALTAMEATSVLCLLSGWSGSELKLKVEQDTFAAFDVLDESIAANRNLGDTCMFAQISSYDYVPMQMAEGALAQIVFTVTVQTIK